jgi:hypothetical protein
MLELLLLAFCAGAIVKAVDWLDDDAKSPHPSKYALAALYGGVIGYLIAVAPFSVMFLAALAAQVFAKKVDTLAHRVGLAIAMLVVLATGMPNPDMWLFLMFLTAAFLDEMDYVGALRPLTDWRPFLKLAAFIILLEGKPEYFLAIILFDIGYEMFRLAAGRQAPKKAKPRK